MSAITSQVHGKFKVFAGELGADHSLGALGKSVEQFAATSKCAAKSIGVEYLESSRRLIVTLGYRDDEAGYPIKLHAVSLGKTTSFDAPELERLEKKMSDAAA